MRGVLSAVVAGLLVAVATGCSGQGDHVVSVPAPQTSRPPTTAAPTASARATTASSPAARIPAEFWGSFNTDPKVCGTDSEGSMVADAHSLRYYEGGGPVTSVVRAGNVITITATWNAEGTTQTETFDLSISADGETVTDLTTDTLRHRCH